MIIAVVEAGGQYVLVPDNATQQRGVLWPTAAQWNGDTFCCYYEPQTAGVPDGPDVGDRLAGRSLFAPLVRSWERHWFPAWACCNEL